MEELRRKEAFEEVLAERWSLTLASPAGKQMRTSWEITSRRLHKYGFYQHVL